MNPGAFAPWITYKFLQVNTPFVRTNSKLLMGGQTMTIRNVANGISSTNFHCVKEDNEWKARVNNAAQHIAAFVLDYLAGYPPNEVLTETAKCWLQDISIFRTKDGIPGLRFDYGFCPIGHLVTGEQSFILIGLKKVRDGTPTPGLVDFFKGVCSNSPASLMNLTRGMNCSGSSVDFLQMKPFGTCFKESSAFTILDRDNGFPVFPVTDTDWAWLQSQLPVEAANENPCAPSPVPKITYGEVVVDRMCLRLDGVSECSKYCTKYCEPFLSGNTTTGTTTMPINPPICFDCEWYMEALTSLFATYIAIWLSHSCWECFGQRGYAWYYHTLGKGRDDSPYSPMLTSANQSVLHSGVRPDIFAFSVVSMGFMSLFWTISAFYLVNLIDYVFEEVIFGWDMCLKLWSFEFDVSKAWNDGTNIMVPPNQDCWFRFLALIIITWLSIWFLFSYWQYWKVAAVREIITTEKEFVEMEVGGFGMMSGGALNSGGVAAVPAVSTMMANPAQSAMASMMPSTL